ncbi:tRNA (guanosine(37)-N1)-methyltransferase TrmD [Candidatus Kuenenbacteria bacterium CG10_big_fil_rev_8_21_14_0_10_36_11]|uniref:tRNA (guanine-N(1)-)-methyltransferase n=1 Tax=Candidatus Kuenenbacteria bacterium CG10_big_fil_rev_8_21_14_0_10_36_11 TaxID=1974618 RepID=A0A2M6WAG2_9BACT|nr:MAG: tRNA (guanosine(37)-N1)-methyltransferase TrmD [Candidatus Kuenenbacteria bacterium CG10_big_fil_rev_8_21_14_0_10_36_11]
MRFDIITIFPKLFDSFLNESLIKKSAEKRLNTFFVHDLRQWAKGIHKQVDDRPYGGGPGMLMMAEPIVKAIKALKHKNIKTLKQKNKKYKNTKIILLSPAGKQFTGELAKKLSQTERLIFICGRYEGVDARIEKLVDEKISLGPYVLNGGELPAMVIIEAVARLLSGFVGNQESLKEETCLIEKKIKKEYPQYTRPEVLEIAGRKYRVPKILLSGDHKKIIEWRDKRCG